MKKKIVKKVKKVSKKKQRKVSKKKPVIRKIQTTKESRKDFEVFAKGVERLEELKAELNSLNTSGYEAEANAIRSKLKNVSYIPQIEKEIRILKSRIEGVKEKPAKIVDDSDKVNKKIRELEKEFNKRKKASYKKQLSSSEMKLIKGLPRIEGQINYLKNTLRQQQINERRKKELLKKIDPGVNLLVNNQFDLSLNEIKAELSRKLKIKETQIKKQLQNDLEVRKKNFDLKYKDLENKFAKRYEDRVQAHLENEVKNKFSDALRARVEELRRKLKREANIKLNNKSAELKARENQKIKDLENRKSQLVKKLNNERAILVKRLNNERKALLGKLAKENKQRLNEKEKKLKQRENEVMSRLGKRFFSKSNKKLSENSKLLSKREQKLIKNLRSKLNKKLAKEKAKLDKKSNKTLDKLKEKQFQLRELIKKEHIKELNREKILHAKELEQQKRINARELEEKRKELQVRISRKQVSDLKRKLIKEFEMKRANLERTYGAKLIEEKRNLKKHADEELLAERVGLNNKLHEHLTSEVEKLHQEYAMKTRQADAKVELMKKRIASEKNMLAKIRNQLNSEIRKVRENDKVYKEKLRQRLKEEKHQAIKKAVAEQSAIIKDKLRQEFNNKLKLQVKAKQAEFDKRKADLALEIQQKAKSLFV